MIISKISFNALKSGAKVGDFIVRRKKKGCKIATLLYNLSKILIVP